MILECLPPRLSSLWTQAGLEVSHYQQTWSSLLRRANQQRRHNRVLLRLLYASGIRVAELCALRWRDVRPRAEGAGQIAVWGKGAKECTILLPPSVYGDLLALRAGRRGAGGRASVPLAQGRRAGIAAKVSPHWLRHSHATHALDRQVPIRLVAATLGHASVATTGKYLHARPSDSSVRYLVV